MESSLERILSDISVGDTKMINDCGHKCSKAVGFSYPGVVLHCSECEAKTKKGNTLENVDTIPQRNKKRKETNQKKLPEVLRRS